MHMLFSASFNPFLPPREKVMFYKSTRFQHFDYLYNLIRKCSSRVGKIPNMVGETQVPSSDMIKIRYIGHVTADNMKFVSNRKGNVFINIISFDTVFKRFYIIKNHPHILTKSILK